VRFLALGLAAVVLAVGCGGGSGNDVGGGVGGITITVTSPVGAAAVDGGLVLPITVNVANDSSNAGVIWSVAPQVKGGPVGSLTDIQAESVTYNPPPPAQLGAPAHVILTATSVTDPTRAVTIPIIAYPAVTFPPQAALDTAFLNTDYACILQPITQVGVTQRPCSISVAGGLGPYTWALDGNTLLPDGLFLGRGLTASDTSIVGKPTLSGVYPFTLRVTDSLGGTNTLSLNINVAPALLKVATPTILSTFVGKPYAPVALQVSGGVPPYVWSLAPGSAGLAPGMSLSPTGVIAGTPTTADQAFFAVRVRDSQLPVPAEATFPTPAPNPSPDSGIIKLTPTDIEPPCLLSGNSVAPDTPYAFVFTGFDANGPLVLSGSFTSDSHGNITGGVEDIIRTTGAQLAQPLAAGGSILFDPTRRGCMTLNTAGTSAQFRLVATTKDPNMGSYRDGRILEFDDTDGTGTRGTGSFWIQDSTAFSTDSIAGQFAFHFSGWDNGGGHFAMAGRATADAGLFTSIFADVNDAGASSGPLNGGSGTFGTVDSNGRGTATIAVGAGLYSLIYYIVDANHLVFSPALPRSSGHPLITGEAVSSNGPFSQSSLNNSHIYRLGGSVAGTADLNIGLLHFDGVSALGGTSYTRSGGTANATALAGQFAIDSNTGRIVFSGTAIPAVGYLVAEPGGLTAYLVGTGPSASSGVIEFQSDSSHPFDQFAPIIGNYGVAVDEMLGPLTPVFIGNNNASNNPPGGLGANDSYLDGSSPAVGLLPLQQFKLFRFTWNADGSGTYGGNTYMVANVKKVFYIDISPLNSHPAVVIGQRSD
jgi:hypothetical protein